MGMQAKFILFAVPCIALFAGFIGLVTIQREEDLLLRNATQQGMGIARISSVLFTNARIYEDLGMVDTSGMSDYLDYFVADVMRLDPRIVFFMVFDPEGRVVAHNNLREYGRLYTDPATRAALSATYPTVRRDDSEELGPLLDIAVPLSIGSKRWGACRIGFSLGEMYRSLDRLRSEVMGISAVLLLTALCAVWYAGRHFSRPLTALTRTMNDITARGDLAAPVPALPPREDEIGLLQASFLWMVRRLREAERERLRNVEGMHQAEKLASIGQLASGVAHEINNPLGGVILCFRNLVAGGMDEATRRQHEEVIDDGLERIRRIVRELMHYARPAPLAMCATRVDDLFARTASLADFTLQRQGVTLVCTVAPDVPPLSTDPDKMDQVLLNLVLNGADAMPGGGVLTLDARLDPGAGSTVRITVRDTGPGVPEEHRERIFDPFFTTKHSGQGTGLGLAVSAAIVARHGGTLALEPPVPGDPPGAVFVISLPLSGTAP
jgi:signal transduction histidine kinase